ncbi:NfeD family protein [Ochrobactrum sp. SFR4]|uniref:NfeD family protein n=1 Tax=Ochrobactrum sp. SFR4 TaxID=2717368 RepID=UPI000EFACB2F|nr:NfeD family protein [Ochrobactrum sp. SFR4]MBX8825216.1 NfeD family protein [Ochrobactrum sp. SFR4]
MMPDMLAALGIWNWVVLGLVLLFLELVTPGVFLIWIGFAALVTSLIAFTGFGFIDSWQAQLLLFMVLSVIFVLIGRKYFNPRVQNSDEPLLNRRADQLIGMRTTLEEPIINGHGRARFDDTLWRVTGPDLPAGTTIIVREYHDGLLQIEEVK